MSYFCYPSRNFNDTQILGAQAMSNMTLKERMETKISRSSRKVFLRSDFENLGEYRQISRALKGLTEEGRLIRLGYGVYAKARKNRLTGQPMIDASGGFREAALEALRRLGVEIVEDPAARAYQQGSTQIPAKPAVVVRGRFSRTISAGKNSLRVARA